MRYVPGFAAATVAYGLIELVGWLDLASASTEVLLFLATYALAVFGFDRAMRRYYAAPRR